MGIGGGSEYILSQGRLHHGAGSGHQEDIASLYTQEQKFLCRTQGSGILGYGHGGGGTGQGQPDLRAPRLGT